MRYLLFVFLILLPSINQAAENSLQSRLETADALFQKRGSNSKAERALVLYEDLYTQNPQNIEIAWRLAMAKYFVGHRVRKNIEEQKKLFEEGRSIGLAAIQANPECARCYFWTALNSALYGNAVGVFKTLRLLKEVREHLQESARLDPNYAFGGAYRVLGIIETKIPKLLGGDRKKALDFFQLALRAAPDEPMNYLELARLYMDKYEDTATAKTFIERGLALGPPPKDRVESQFAQQELETLAISFRQ